MARLIIASSMKNESPYVLEWLAYHRSIGFTEAFVVTNDNSDLSLTLFAELQRELPWFTFVEQSLTEGESPQAGALSIIYNRFKREEGWLFFCDADEFLVLNHFRGVEDLVDRYSDHDAISAYWKVFGSSGHAFKTKGHVIDRFRHCGNHDSPQSMTYKTLINLRTEWRGLGVHKPLHLHTATSLKWIDGAESSIDMSNTSFPNTQPHDRYRLFQLNHYMVKSKAEYRMKQLRGNGLRPATSHLLNENYFNANDMNHCTCSKIHRFRNSFAATYHDIASRGSIARILDMIEYNYRNWEQGLTSEN